MSVAIKYKYAMGGSMSFVDAAVKAIGTDMEPALSAAGWSDEGFPDVPALRRRSKRTASAAVTIVLTVGTWLSLKVADKAFDAVYEKTIRSAVESYVKKALAAVRKYRQDAVEYQSLVYLEDLDVAVLVRLIMEGDEDFKSGVDTINAVHRMAYEKIKSVGKLAEIHCYTILKGSCNIEPELLNDINSVKPEVPLVKRQTLKIGAE